MDFDIDITTLAAELDAQRASMGMSYQDVADACDVSKPTVYRALTGKTQPTMQLMQNIAAAVQYKAPRPEVLPDVMTPDAYISYLKALVRQKEEDMEVRSKQLHAHYNKLLRQARRGRIPWTALSIILIGLLIALFLYDFIHLNRGWIQARAAGLIGGWMKNASMSMRGWLGGT